MIEPILIVAIAIMATVWFMHHRRRDRRERMALRNTTGLELLAKRYARGDISREEYLEKRDDILAAAALGRPVSAVSPLRKPTSEPSIPARAA